MSENANVEVNGEAPVKTAKQLEKEAKKLAKLQKFNQKLDKKKETQTSTKEKPEVFFYFSHKTLRF